MRATVTTLLAAIALGGLAACAINTPAGQATLGENPTLGGGSFTSPGGITVAVEARDIGGLTGICGVWAESINQSVMTRRSAPRILDSGGVSMDGQSVARGLRFLRQVEPATSYGGMLANCITTERPWRAGDETRPLGIHLVRQVVYNGLGGSDFDNSGGGILIWFRPGEPGAHPRKKRPWYHLDGTSVSGRIDSPERAP